MTETIPIVVLAAGSSTRMGDPKQLLPLRGSTLLRHCVEQALTSKASKVYVVVGAYFKKVKASLEGLPLEIVLFPDWKEGMGSSLRKAMEYIIENEDPVAGVLVTLGDLPNLHSGHYNNLIDTYLNSIEQIAITKFENTKGVPVIFGASYFDKLLQLKGDQGAKEIALRDPEDVLEVPASMKYFDVDTPEHYQHLLQQDADQ